MNWHHLWFDPTSNRLRCGWRVLIFIGLATFLSVLLSVLGWSIVLPLLPRSTQLVMYVGELILRIAVIVVFISLGIWALRVFEHLPARTLGLPVRGPWGQTLVIGFIIGVGLITLVLLALRLLGLASFTWHHPSHQAVSLLLLLCLGMLIAGMAEEVIFHGYLFQTLLRGIGPLTTLFFTSALFAMVHLQNPHADLRGVGLLGIVNIFLAGMLFGMLYLRLGTLWLLIGIHAGWDFAQFFFQLPTSGYSLPLSTPFTVKLANIPLLTGGGFGLEGGLAISVLLLGLIAVITYSHRGLSLESHWWEWRELSKTLTSSPPWDFIVDGRYYQWKLLGREGQE